MDVDWPLTGLVVVGLIAATLLFRLLALAAKVSSRAIWATVVARRRLNHATLDLSERSSL